MIVSDPYRADLQWLLLADYEGDLGIRSSFSSMVEALERGGHEERGYVYDLSDHVIEAASRLRRLTRRWEALAPEHRRTLRVHYTTLKRPVEELGDLSAVICTHPLARRLHAESRTSKPLLAWLAGRANDLVGLRLRRDAQSALDAARNAWADTRGIGGRR